MTYTATQKTIPIADLAVAGIIDPVDPDDAANNAASTTWILSQQSMAVHDGNLIIVWSWVEANPP